MINKLTGRKRYRVQHRFFKKPLVILQLEVEGFVPEYSPNGIDGEIRKWWIDAAPEQVMMQEFYGAPHDQ